jgi:hypothetical protein
MDDKSWYEEFVMNFLRTRLVMPVDVAFVIEQWESACEVNLLLNCQL